MSEVLDIFDANVTLVEILLNWSKKFHYNSISDWRILLLANTIKHPRVNITIKRKIKLKYAYRGVKKGIFKKRVKIQSVLACTKMSYLSWYSRKILKCKLFSIVFFSQYHHLMNKNRNEKSGHNWFHTFLNDKWFEMK